MWDRAHELVIGCLGTFLDSGNAVSVNMLPGQGKAIIENKKRNKKKWIPLEKYKAENR